MTALSEKRNGSLLGELYFRRKYQLKVDICADVFDNNIAKNIVIVYNQNK